MEAWYVIFDSHVSGWHKKFVVRFIIFRSWTMESRSASDSGIVIQKIWLDSITKKCTEVKVIWTAGKSSDALKANIFRLLRMEEA